MSQRRRATPSSSPSRSNRHAAPRWPLFAGGVLGLFLVFFLLGLYGLPRRAAETTETTEPAPIVEPAGTVVDPNSVSVRELPEERSSREPEGQREERRRERRRERKPEPESAPSPPAVSAPIVSPTVPDPASAAETPSNANTATGTNAAPPVAAPPPVEIPPAPSASYRVQAGAFGDEENARKLADRLAGSGYQPSVTTSKTSDGTMYRVQVGPFTEKKAAEDAVRDLGQQGVSARVADE